jgi:predicted RND superfamily exporter protein
LTQSLAAVEGVNRVVSLSSLKNDLDILNEWTLEDLRRNLNLADIFVNNLVSADGKTTALVVILDEGQEIDTLTEDIEAVLGLYRASNDPLEIYQIGSPVIGHTLTKFTEKDFKTLPFFTMLVIFLVLVFCFRDFRGAFIPFTAVCFTLVWTFGLMGLLDVSLSMVNMIIPTLLIAVGSAYAMHIMAAYFDEAAQDPVAKQAIVKGLLRVCLPTIFASVTTMVSFGSLLLNRIAIVREFATFSCLGLVFMLIIHLTYIPAALSCLKMKKVRRMAGLGDHSWIGTFLKKVVWTIQNQPRGVIAVASIISVVAAVGLFRIRVETTPISFFRDDSQIKMAVQDVHRKLAGIYPVNVVLRSDRDGYFASPRVLQKVEALQKSLATIQGVDLTVSVVDLLKFEGLFTRSFRNKAKYYVVPDDTYVVREAIKNYRIFDAGDLVDRFISEDFSRINIVCRTHCESTIDFMEAEKTIRSYVKKYFPEGIDFDVTGLCVVGSHSAHALTMGQIKSLGLALVCIFVLVSMLFLSAKVGALAMIPNLFPVIVNFGIMGWFGIHLTVATSLVASIAIGLAVDDTIHFIFRFRQQFSKDFSRRQANYRTIADVGKPIVFTSVAIGLGFSVLLFSSFLPTSIFGALMLITMASALFGDLLILPIIMQATPWLLVVMERGIGSYRKIPLFRNLSLAEARRVILAGLREHCRPGEVVYRQGDLGKGMHLILHGKVRLNDQEAPDGKALMIDLGQGEVFGEIGISKPSARASTATVLEESVLLHIDEHTLNDLEQNAPKIAFILYLNLMAVSDGRMKLSAGTS